MKNKTEEQRKIRTILKEKRGISNKGLRLSTFLVLSITALVTVVLLVYALLFNKIYVVRYSEQLYENAGRQMDRLSSYLADNALTQQDMDYSMRFIADMFEGRLLLIDRDYRILKDTSDLNENAYLVNEDIMRLMNATEGRATIEQDDSFLEIRRVESEGQVIGMLLLQVSTKERNQLSGGFMHINVALSCILLLIVFFSAVFMSSISLRGLKKVGRAMQTAREGHLEDQLPVRGFREYRQLTENYNKTITRLTALDSTRQEFVSNVSHELKTPITSMKVLADSLIANEEADLTMYKEFMKDIALEIDRESEIITDLLTLVKTEKQSGQMNISEENINDLLETVLKRVIPIASERDIDVTYESYRDVVAEIDKVKLSLALTNIIENAVKYNVDGGSVKVSLNADHKNFHIKVADTGVGIPDDCKEKVFDRFYRVDKARSRDTGGTGLGLAITRNVINMHHGVIKLYSESGQGTTFTIKVPIKYSENQADD